MMKADEFLRLGPKRAQEFVEKAQRHELMRILFEIYENAKETSRRRGKRKVRK